MTREELTKWRDIHNATTPGEWHTSQRGPLNDGSTTFSIAAGAVTVLSSNNRYFGSYRPTELDARGIAHEHNTYGRLLDVAERAIVPPSVMDAAEKFNREDCECLKCERGDRLSAFVRSLAEGGNASLD